MGWYINLKTSSNDFEDMFSPDPERDAWMAKIKARREVNRSPEQKIPVTLTLYRGFDADLNKLKANGYILNPQGGDQNVIWFSCPAFQHDAKTVVTRGKYLLTYPLQAVRHVQTIHYNDGETSDVTPDSFAENRTENCRFYGGYEIPEGWAFSYKTQKYIICEKPLKVSPSMITEQQYEEGR